MPQVRLLATRQHRLCPPTVELDELMSVATVGLLQAVEKFRPERGFKLKTLAEHRIRGAMPIDQVSILLGHASVKTTEKYYAPWIGARQRLLDEAVATLDFVEINAKKKSLNLVK